MAEISFMENTRMREWSNMDNVGCGYVDANDQFVIKHIYIVIFCLLL